MNQEVCNKCGRPKESQTSASLTHWIAVCTCDLQQVEPPDGKELRLCRACGKRIEKGRPGSLTQWIFRSDICSCEQPALSQADDNLQKQTLAANSSESDSPADRSLEQGRPSDAAVEWAAGTVPYAEPRKRQPAARHVTFIIFMVSLLVPSALVLWQTLIKRTPEVKTGRFSRDFANLPAQELPEERKRRARSAADLFWLDKRPGRLICAARVNDLEDDELSLMPPDPINEVVLGVQPHLTDAALRVLARYPVRVLNIEQSQITDAGLESVAKGKSIVNLVVRGSKIAGKSFSALSRHMTVLIVDGSPVEDENLAGLAGMQVYSLSLAGDSKLTDQGMVHLQNLKCSSLDVPGCAITDEGLQTLSKSKSIQIVSLRDTAVTIRGLERLASTRNLLGINLDNCPAIGDDTLSMLSRKAPHLRQLLLSSTNITVRGLKFIKELKELRDLRLSCKPFNDDDLEFLTSLTALNRLDLARTAITDRTLQRLEALPHLKALSVSYCEHLSEPGIQRARKHFAEFRAELAGLSLERDAGSVPSDVTLPPGL